MINNQLSAADRTKFRALVSMLLPRLTTEQRPLGRLVFQLSDTRLLASVVGFDSPGILEYLTGKFNAHEVDIETCYGEALESFDGDRFAGVQGSFFEITGTNEDELHRLHDEFMTDDFDFEVKEKFRAERFFDLQFKFPRYERPFLHAVAEILLAHNININFFRQDKVDDFLQGEEPGLFPYQVSMFARLEFPEGADEQLLKNELLSVCPEGLLTLRERPRRLPTHGNDDDLTLTN